MNGTKADKGSYPLAEYFGVGSSCSERTHSRRPDSHKLSLLMIQIRYTVIIMNTIQGRFALTRIGNCFNRRYRPW